MVTTDIDLSELKVDTNRGDQTAESIDEISPLLNLPRKRSGSFHIPDDFDCVPISPVNQMSGLKASQSFESIV